MSNSILALLFISCLLSPRCLPRQSRLSSQLYSSAWRSYRLPLGSIFLLFIPTVFTFPSISPHSLLHFLPVALPRLPRFLAVNVSWCKPGCHDDGFRGNLSPSGWTTMAFSYFHLPDLFFSFAFSHFCRQAGVSYRLFFIHQFSMVDLFVFFLDAPSHLYKRSCPFVRRSVRPSVRRSVPCYF